ncbi:uncharacterized protein RJT21DRAFT_124670 [Scheffersomyces amazonensis]|uniref:uncharacterized protein n=1 Tax=Scheffersomyces amazonensis TaxID=1078765 RepID=UPI00315D4A6C
MRSLPPPRVTRSRRWKRIRKAIASFFKRGRISDKGAFVSSSKVNLNSSISTIKKSRITSRIRKANFTDGVGLIDGANAGLKTASMFGKLIKRASFPAMTRKSSKINMTVRF